MRIRVDRFAETGCHQISSRSMSDSEPDKAYTRRQAVTLMGLAVAIAAATKTVLSAAPAQALVGAPGGMFYPTDPWRYNGSDGTRYLDPRPGGRVHEGIDAQGSRGQAVFATLAGTVVGGTWGSSSGDGHGFGNNVLLSHGGGLWSRYAHFDGAPTVPMGLTVGAGQQIGRMGNSQFGPTSGMAVHLHFEVYIGSNSSHRSPLAFFAGSFGTHNPTEGDDLTPEQDLRLRNIENMLIGNGTATGVQPGGALDRLMNIENVLLGDGNRFQAQPGSVARRMSDVHSRVNYATRPNGSPYLVASQGDVDTLLSAIANLAAKVDQI